MHTRIQYCRLNLGTTVIRRISLCCNTSPPRGCWKGVGLSTAIWLQKTDSDTENVVTSGQPQLVETQSSIKYNMNRYARNIDAGYVFAIVTDVPAFVHFNMWIVQVILN